MRTLSILLAVAACTGPTSDPTARKAPETANVDLDSHHVRVSQSADTAWSLTKTGSIDTAAKTVTWTITATRATTATDHLTLTGTLRVKNTGSGPATIGNIVVNLQTKGSGGWATATSDIADATTDDAATTANTQNGTLTENAASGSLQFTDAHNNSAFSLVPEVTIPAHQTVELDYAASYDNSLLGLAQGTKIRGEVLVTFGNHGPNGNVGTDIDINGNGVIDADEAYVRTVSDREELKVPAATSGNTTATLTDTAADISTTGTVTYDNASFNLGATSGTVTAHVDGGSSGGDITNCAHLVTSSGQTLDACNTQTIGANACVDGTSGCGWKDNDVVTYPQDSWGDGTSTAGQLLGAQFLTIYPGGVEVGIPGAGGFSMLFSDQIAVYNYLPQLGVEGALIQDLVDPTTSSSGAYGGDVLALQIDVDFDDAGLLGRTSATHLGDLTVCGITNMPLINGLPVRQVLADANIALGGGTTLYDAQTFATVVGNLAGAFGGGSVTVFAQQHLFVGACPP